MSLDLPLDLLVVGGGINGAGVARDAAGRGLSVMLCEQHDLASGTSSTSSKLIHGGLRYLEYFQFRLVREALAEREVLLEIAPHVVQPLRFVLPHVPSMRPVWMLRAGLLLYDLLGRRRRLPRSRHVNLRRHEGGAALQGDYSTGFTYSDCATDDARLVALNARDAADRGAHILTRTQVRAARREGALWHVTLADTARATTRTVTARALVYAAGPWMKHILDAEAGLSTHHLRLVKGSHLVFPRFFEGSHAFILQNDDGRVVFAIPYLERFTLVGTTEVDFQGDPATAHIDPAEGDYLCAVINRYFRANVSPADAVWSFSGLRPLIDDDASNPSAVSREYILALSAPAGQAPVVSIIGGKLTSYRQVSEKTVEQLAPFFPGLRGPWTRHAPLPGGDLGHASFESFLGALGAEFPWLDPAHLRRMGLAYGTLAREVLGDARSLGDLGTHFGGQLYEREVVYLMRREWALSADDLLWRRSKQGLELSAPQAEHLQSWMATRQAAPAAETAAS